MEILSTEYHILSFWIWMILCISALVVFLILTFIGFQDLIKNGLSEGIIPALLISIGFTNLLGFTTYLTFKEGVQVEYKAIITDFNDVYKNGYEVVNQEGKIYTLRKVD